MRVSYNKTIIESLGREYLINIISEASSLTDVLRKYNLSVSGSSIKILKKIIDNWGISLDSLEKNNWKYNKNKSRKRTFDEVFCINSEVCQAVLKDNVLKYKILDNTKCSICKIENIWNNKPFTMILDHINGINNDNKIENLRYICPICNSQLNTTGSKNPNFPRKIKKYYCVDCEKEISRGSLRCVKCSNIKSRKIKNRPFLNILEKDIALLGYRGTGKKYGVSDNAVRKWVERSK